MKNMVLGMIAVIALGIIIFNIKNKLKGDQMSILTVESNDFADGEKLPVDCTCDGKNLSPHLSWGNVPVGVKSFSIICEDPDAPHGAWHHWSIFNIPPVVHALEQGVPVVETLQNGSQQGVNDSGEIGYGGACPPKGHGKHRYIFTVYALDTMLDVKPKAKKAEIVSAMQEHVVASGQIIGTYSRD